MAATAQLDVRAQFPTLDREGVAYLDSAATSQTPDVVLAAMDDYYRHHRASVHRGTYPLASEATDLFEGARTRIAAFVNWAARDTVFTRNASEALNLVAHGWGRRHVGPGDRILVTRMEHHSNFVPWWMLAQGDGRRARRGAGRRRGRDRPRRPRRAAAGRQAARDRPRLQRGRDDQPDRRDRAACARCWRRHRGRRLAGRAADAGRPGRAGRRLLRLDRPQGLRPDRRRRAARPPRPAARHRAADRRRPHDLQRVVRRGPLGGAAGALRGGDVGDRRGHRPRRRGRLARRPRHGQRARPRGRADRLRAGAPRRRGRRHAARPARRRAPRRAGLLRAQGRSPARRRPRSSAAAASASGPATTAPSR